jgi:ATP-binding cassette, subfamily C, bacterial
VIVSRSIVGTLWRFVQALVAAAPRQAALTAVVMLLLSVVEGTGLVLLVPLLQLVGVDAGPSAGSRFGAGLSAAFGFVGLTPTLGSVLAVYVAIAVLQSLLQRRQTELSASMRQRTEAALRMRLYRAVGRADWQFIARSRMSTFSHMLTSELDRIGTAAHDLAELSVVSLVVAVYLGIAFRLSPAITVLVLASGGVLALLLRRRVGEAHRLGRDMTETRGRLHAAVTEHLGSLKTVKSYGALDQQCAIFETLTNDVMHVNLKTIGGYASLRQETVVGSAVILAATIYVAKAIVAVPTAHLLMLLFLFSRLMPRLTGLIERAQTLATVLPSFAAFDDLERRARAAAEPTPSGQRPLELTCAIRFERVTFRYAGSAAAPALDRLDLTIHAGTTTAIVGPSGAGKSTCADLLLGLIVPTEGLVHVDGEVLDPSHLDDWRRQIGYVHQDTFLFHDTVRANLLWAEPTAKPADLDRALALAAADEFVARLPDGLDTVIGDRGVLLSGGERQRLALARALLRRPRLLVLDEATNALDFENESRIQKAIDQLRQHMTIVVITHRLSAVQGADAVHVLEQGRLVESGTWTGLMARPGSRFRQLSEAQSGQQPESKEPAILQAVAP